MAYAQSAWFRRIAVFVSYVYLICCVSPTQFGVRPESLPKFHFGPESAYADPVSSGMQPLGEVMHLGTAVELLDPQGQNVRVRYVVANSQKADLVGVRLGFTLLPGVTLRTSTPGASADGSELSFSLGTISGFSVAQAVLELHRDVGGAGDLDGGTTAYASLNGLALSSSTTPAHVKIFSGDPSLLTSSKEIDTTDPYIIAQAGKLDYDPARIFAFVRDEIKNEVYVGSLKGSRGVLFHRGGNSVDKASLLIALLRASGIPAQYAQGELDSARAKEIIRSMFPAKLSVVGYVAAGDELADPENDAELLERAKAHTWVQLDADGSGFTSADPCFSSASFGDVFASSESTLIELPDTQRHLVTIRVKAETTTPSLLGGSYTDESPVLEATFSAAELSGRPIHLQHFISANSPPAVLISYTAFTYSPYLVVDRSDGAANNNNEFIVGSDFQEVLTNFPFSSQALTGEFLEVDTIEPGGAVRTDRKTILDRIGYDIRQHGGTPSFGGASGPAFSNFDINTIFVASGDVPEAFETRRGTGLAKFQSELAVVQPQVEALSASNPTSLDPQQQALADSARELQLNGTREFMAFVGERFLGISTLLNEATQGAAFAKIYPETPRIFITSQRATIDGSNQGHVSTRIDLLKDNTKIVLAPGQSTNARFAAGLQRGIAENLAETTALEVPGQVAPISTTKIFQAAQAQNISQAMLSSANAGLLETFTLSGEAKARISQALNNGKLVITPSAMVTIGEVTTVGWYEIDGQTAETIGVLEDGSHGVEWGALIVGALEVFFYGGYFFFLGFLGGFATVYLPGIFLVLAAAITKSHKTDLENSLDQISNYVGVGGLNPATPGYFDILPAAIAKLISFFGIVSVHIALAAGVGLMLGVVAGIETAIAFLRYIISHSDPLVQAMKSNLVPLGDFSIANTTVAGSGTLAGSTFNAAQQTEHSRVSGNLDSTWTGPLSVGAEISSLLANSASVSDMDGVGVGGGTVSLSGQSTVSAQLSISGQFQISGTGDVSFYGPSTALLGTSGTWKNFDAEINGNALIVLRTDRLLLNGNFLPLGTYSISLTSAQLRGSGAGLSTNFIPSVDLSFSDAALTMGQGSGSLTFDVDSLDASQGYGLSGAAGTVSALSAGNEDVFTSSGTAGNIALITLPTLVLAADQNTSVIAEPSVLSNLNTDFQLSARAPPGWTLIFAPDGKLSITPANGTQSGTFPIYFSAQSKDVPSLVATAKVEVNVGATAPGVNLAVVHDPALQVSFNGADVPSAFTVEIRNLGPVQDHFSLNILTPPSGFDLQLSESSLEIPPGGVAQFGAYLFPNAPLPAPGTIVTFELQVTSDSDGAITDGAIGTFVVPEIHAVRASFNPPRLSTPPGAPVSSDLKVENVGNVDEPNIELEFFTPANLFVSGLTSPKSLAMGDSTSESITFTPDGAAQLNMSLGAQLVVTYGDPLSPQKAISGVGIEVAIPGAGAADQAALNAALSGDPILAKAFDDLGRSITELFLNPGDAVSRQTVISDMNNLITILDGDEFDSINSQLASVRDTVETGTNSQVLNILDFLGSLIDEITQTIAASQKYNFKIYLLPDTAVAQPNVPTVFNVFLQSVGTQSTDIEVSLNAVGNGVTGVVNNGMVTLPPGGVTQLPNVTLTFTGSQLTPLGFQVSAVVLNPDGAFITHSARGSLTVRNEAIQVFGVVAGPPFVTSGNPVNVFARAIGSLNTPRNVKFFYTVENSTGTVVVTSSAVAEPFTIDGNFHDLILPQLDTTGLADGQYKIRVKATEDNGTPFAGAEAVAGLFIGTPIEASLSVSPELVSPGFSNLFTTLTVKSAGGLGAGLELLGQTPLAATSGLEFAIKDDKAYIGTNSSIIVADISDPSNPQVINTITPGGNMPVQGLILGGANNDQLIVGGQRPIELADLPPNPTTPIGTNWASVVNVFSLADPTTPSLLTTTPLVMPYRQFFVGIYPHGDRAYMLQGGYRYYVPGNDVFNVWGGVVNVDVSNAAAPALIGSFYTDTKLDPINPALLVEGFGPGFSTSIVDVNDSTVFHLTTTSSQDQPSDGQGVVRVFSLANPASPTIAKSVIIPNTVHILDGAVDGTHVLLLGSTGGIKDPADFHFTGNLVLTELDITDPLNPVVTKQKNFPALKPDFVTRIKKISAGKWFIGENFRRVSDSQAVFGIVDSSIPGDIALDTLPAFPDAGAYQFQIYKGNLVVVAPPPGGLKIYSLDNINAAKVTAKVDVPRGINGGYVPGTFNVPPSSITNNGTYDTLFWDSDKFPLPYQEFQLTITWMTQVFAMKAVEARKVINGGTVDFLYNGGAGTIDLPPQFVSSGFVLGLTPPSRGIQPGLTAQYFVKIDNSFGSTTTYNLKVVGINPDWVSFPSQVTVLGHTSEFPELYITPSSDAPLTEYHFTVLATPQGFTSDYAGAVQGSLVVAGDPIRPDGIADGVKVQLIPSAAVAGQGVPANYRVRVTNTGQSTRYVVLTFSAPGFDGVLDTNLLQVLPGKSNFKETTLSLTPQAGNTSGADPFTVTAITISDDTATDTANGIVNVISQGVALELNPPVGQPNFQVLLKVTNKGTATDTFSLSVAGPAAPFVELTEQEVTLPPGASQNVTILTGDLPISLPGNLTLIASAVSQANSAAQAQVRGEIEVASTRDMDLEFLPDQAVLAQPGDATFFLQVDNVGNVADQYSVEIVDTTSDLTASLVGLTGDAVQSVPLFRLPGLSKGGFLVNANKPSLGDGTVTVRLTSNSSDLFMEATALVRVLGSDDLCPDDETKTSPGTCGCNVPDIDSDGDGAADCVDSCSLDPAKTAPGFCGCGVSDVDSDQDGFRDCNDSCPFNEGKNQPGVCGCEVADTDTDADGTPDCTDACPSDAQKISTGICGCGTSDVDTDGDGTADCNDTCPNDGQKQSPGLCGCGISDIDSDDDGIPNCNDTCPLEEDEDDDGVPDCQDSCPVDSTKTLPGACGCGVADTDSDDDNTADCNDSCPMDSAKVQPGVCGCGLADADRDSDGTLDCLDSCASDPLKTTPGICGCGDAETDSDADGTPDCSDTCPADKFKLTPGVCGCGTADTDTDDDGTPDCQELPSTCVGECSGDAPNADDDGDGISNCTEQTDHTDPCDSGSFVPRLVPMSCAGANGYLQQINIATVLNKLSTPLGFNVQYRDSMGVLRGQVGFVLDPNLKRDIILNDLGLQPDTYGTVCVMVSTTAEGAWSGGITLYKARAANPQLSSGEEFDFALYYPFENPQKGTATLTLNTNSIGTDGKGLVANWIRLTDAKKADGNGLHGLLKYYRADGTLATDEVVNIPDGGRFDFPAHERLGMNSIGLVEFLPDNAQDEFYFEESRYFYEGVAATSKNFYTAFTIPRRPLTGAALTGRTPVKANEVSVLEIINGSSSPAQAALKLFGDGGSALGNEQFDVAAKGSVHRIILSGTNTSGDIQTAEVSGPAESLGATTLSYVFGKDNNLLYGYAQPFAQSAGVIQFTEFNSFIGHKSVLDLSNSTDKKIPLAIRVLNFDNTTLQNFSSEILPRANLTLDLAVPPSTYGTVIVDSGSEVGVVALGRVERAGQYVLTFPGK